MRFRLDTWLWHVSRCQFCAHLIHAPFSQSKEPASDAAFDARAQAASVAHSMIWGNNLAGISIENRAVRIASVSGSFC